MATMRSGLEPRAGREASLGTFASETRSRVSRGSPAVLGGGGGGRGQRAEQAARRPPRRLAARLANSPCRGTLCAGRPAPATQMNRQKRIRRPLRVTRARINMARGAPPIGRSGRAWAAANCFHGRPASIECNMLILTIQRASCAADEKRAAEFSKSGATIASPVRRSAATILASHLLISPLRVHLDCALEGARARLRAASGPGRRVDVVPAATVAAAAQTVAGLRAERRLRLAVR